MGERKRVMERVMCVRSVRSVRGGRGGMMMGRWGGKCEWVGVRSQDDDDDEVPGGQRKKTLEHTAAPLIVSCAVCIHVVHSIGMPVPGQAPICHSSRGTSDCILPVVVVVVVFWMHAVPRFPSPPLSPSPSLLSCRKDSKGSPPLLRWCAPATNI
jgi:hypothetical protein